jgi:hypothetical protein
MVHTHYVAAGWTLPADFLSFQKILNTMLLDPLKVLDHAHPILGPVAFVQLLHSPARKLLTLIAEA